MVDFHGDDQSPTQSQHKKSFLRASSLNEDSYARKASPRGQSDHEDTRGRMLVGKFEAEMTRRNEININVNLNNNDIRVMTLGDLRSISQIVHHKRDHRNIYDIKSQKKLQCVLRNGYSYKFREKKQYKTNQKQQETGYEPTTNAKQGQRNTIGNSELSLLAALRRK